jgi:hypothetical protein
MSAIADRAIAWGKRPMPGTRGGWLIAGVAVVLVLWVVPTLLDWGGQTAESYCRGLGGTTPAWATNNGWFSDYPSCGEWYRDTRDQLTR